MFKSLPVAEQVRRPGESLHQDFVGNLEHQHRVESLAGSNEEFLEQPGLRLASGKAVEYEAGGAIVLVEPLAQKLHDQFVGNQFAGIHGSLGATAEQGAGGDCSPEQIAGGHLGPAHAILQPTSLRTLARAGRAQKHYPHWVLRPILLVQVLSYTVAPYATRFSPCQPATLFMRNPEAPRR